MILICCVALKMRRCSWILYIDISFSLKVLWLTEHWKKWIEMDELHWNTMVAMHRVCIRNELVRRSQSLRWYKRQNKKSALRNHFATSSRLLWPFCDIGFLANRQTDFLLEALFRNHNASADSKQWVEPLDQGQRLLKEVRWPILFFWWKKSWESDGNWTGFFFGRCVCVFFWWICWFDPWKECLAGIWKLEIYSKDVYFWYIKRRKNGVRIKFLIRIRPYPLTQIIKKLRFRAMFPRGQWDPFGGGSKSWC